MGNNLFCAGVKRRSYPDPQHFLYFFPLLQEHGSLRPGIASLRIVSTRGPRLFHSWRRSYTAPDRVAEIVEPALAHAGRAVLGEHRQPELAGVVLGLAAGYPANEEIERRLAMQPAINVPSVTLDGKEDGVVRNLEGQVTLR